ncbi:hypothetical protein ACFU7Y_41325 [Kitasatospora sp. NPDC057542]|uniref:hypothetical protein n=1 Tax=Kitasatospora sp. NPDC057542 TaxID=3346162 RepID=UPI0036BBD827
MSNKPGPADSWQLTSDPVTSDGKAHKLSAPTEVHRPATRTVNLSRGEQYDDEEPPTEQPVRDDRAREVQQWGTARQCADVVTDCIGSSSRRSASWDEIMAGPSTVGRHSAAVHRKPGITVAVTAGSGTGAGRSVLALALARELSRAGSDVLLLTADRLTYEAVECGALAPRAVVDRGEHGEPAAGSVAVWFWDECDDRLVQRAGQWADAVVLDTWTGYRSGTVPVDVEVAVCRYRTEDWQDHLVQDRRPYEIRVLEWLDEEFARFRSAARRRAGVDERALLAYLEANFQLYARARERSRDTDVYDSSDPESVAEFWAMDYDLDEWGAGQLQFEGRVPLDEWRAHFIAYVDADGRDRHPVLWEAVAGKWVEHSGRLNLEHVARTVAADGAELHRLLEDFLPAITPSAIQRWGLDFANTGARFRDAVIHRWLDRSCEAYARTRRPQARHVLDDLLRVLDVRFIAYAKQRLAGRDIEESAAELFAALGVEPVATVWRAERRNTMAMDRWWSVEAATHLAGAVVDENDGPLDAWREVFLAQVDDEGARRHPTLWPRIRAEWAQRNRERNRAGLAPRDAHPAERRSCTAKFTADVAPLAEQVWGPRWRAVAEAWMSGQAPLLDRLEEYDWQVELVPVDREPQSTADALLCHRAGHVVTVLAVDHAPQDLAEERVHAVSRALRERGVAGLAVVAGCDAAQSALLGRRIADGERAPGIESLARAVVTAVATRGHRPE